MTLRECPFCGGEAVDIGKVAPQLCPVMDVEGVWWVHCYGCETKGPDGAGEAEAIAAWNRRADGWVSVEERLPEKNLLVLGWYAGRVEHHGSTWRREGFHFAVHWGEQGWNHRLIDEAVKKLDADFLSVTHWQPLPAAPEVKR